MFPERSSDLRQQISSFILDSEEVLGIAPFIEFQNSDPLLRQQNLKAYSEALFFVESLDHPIRVGKTSTEVDELLKKYNQREWVYITAFNPAPKTLTEEENLKRNKELELDLQNLNLKYFPGVGIDETGHCNGGRGEDSFLVLGATPEIGDQLMEKWDQLAIVRGRIGEPAILRFY